MAALPTISVIIPTLNSSRTLEECLRTIREQDYPPDAIEIVVADGGSIDATYEIAKRYDAVIVSNPLVTGEAGKAAALRAARNDIVALIDSDNIIVGRDWFRRMVAPFEEPSIVGTEPIRFVAIATDGTIDRYCAIAGANDPLCLFIGVYDKYSAMTGKWTGLRIQDEDRGDFRVFSLDQRLPTIGANGTLYRREQLAPIVGEYLIDIDIPVILGQRHKSARFAKVQTGIRHLYCKDTSAFIRKQTRRVRDYFATGTGHSQRVYPWRRYAVNGALRLAVACITVIPLLIQSGRAYARTRDFAAFYHPVACWLTLGVYGLNFTFNRGRAMSRAQWRQ
ncbi:MAG TPA: glycosyltransferase [Candidatus Acidoferrales bacterium]|nr:glycosyltransferase [Candidatus Acidoferrales bacterium]